MKNKKLIERIVLNPKVMVGKPVIRGTRLTVDYILNLLAHGSIALRQFGDLDILVHRHDGDSVPVEVMQKEALLPLPTLFSFIYYPPPP